MNKLQLAIIGAGLIGKRHISTISRSTHAKVFAIADPVLETEYIAQEVGAKYFATVEEMLSEIAGHCDGIIIASPNNQHVTHGLACLKAGYPVLIEKPLADNVSEANRLVEEANRLQIPMLVGHHRRHNPLIRAAKRSIDAGELGNIISVHGHCWFYKPDNYFDNAWRRQKGAGPVFINLIHDIDLIRHLCGEIIEIHAFESNNIRQFEVEDTAVISFKLAGGGLGTMTVSDCVVAPWSWEFTAGENPAYPHVGQNYAMIGGTRASLSLPDVKIWRHSGKRSWWNPIHDTALDYEKTDVLAAQIGQFCAVIKGWEEPLVSGEDGLQSLKVIEAVKHSALKNKSVIVDR